MSAPSNRRKITTVSLGVAALAASAMIIGPAVAHTPSGDAACSGLWAQMRNAPDDFTTTITLELDGQVVFSDTRDGDWRTPTKPVPQDYDSHRFAWVVDGEGTKYDDSDSGDVGPCKTKPTHSPSPSATEPEETPSPSASETPSSSPSPTPTPSSTSTPIPSQPTTSTPSAPPSTTPAPTSTEPSTPGPQPSAPTPNIGTPEHQELPDCADDEYWQNNRGCVPLAPRDTVEEGY